MNSDVGIDDELLPRKTDPFMGIIPWEKACSGIPTFIMILSASWAVHPDLMLSTLNLSWPL